MIKTFAGVVIEYHRKLIFSNRIYYIFIVVQSSINAFLYVKSSKLSIKLLLPVYKQGHSQDFFKGVPTGA